MKISFLGAAQTVTGSQHLLEVNNSKILIECGLYQGRHGEAYERNSTFPFEASAIDVVIVTHAHMDHCGNLPNLVRQGFAGSIYATSPTVDLCKIMLKDSAFLQEKDTEWINRIRHKQKLPPLEPLYTLADVETTLEQLVDVDYDHTFTLAAGVNARFLEGGHILGSGSIIMEIDDGSRSCRLGYAGDIGRNNMPVIHDPNLPRQLDMLIMECTYGNRHHGPVEDREEQLAHLVNEAANSGGKLVIPAFAVGRTQELIYIFHKLYNENRIPDIPIYVDSPLANAATNVFRKHRECFDRETNRIFIDNGEEPFEFSRLTYTTDVAQSKALLEQRFPHVIISASGMAEGGRIMHHLRNNLDNHKAIIAFVGYAAKETLARQIVDGAKKVKIFGEEHRVKARIERLDTFSAHADRRDLLNYVKFCPPGKLKHIFLVHGEEDQAIPLKDALRSKGYPFVVYPRRGESYDIDL
ncbi:MAG: MBL fold metallo-hydrolase [Chitinivibrionales bacterium]|nr:MBL fold metallo-hydrolase [Chitinivibrionales bacterium]